MISFPITKNNQLPPVIGIENTVALLNEDVPCPLISRYRKERTGKFGWGEIGHTVQVLKCTKLEALEETQVDHSLNPYENKIPLTRIRQKICHARRS